MSKENFYSPQKSFFKGLKKNDNKNDNIESAKKVDSSREGNNNMQSTQFSVPAKKSKNGKVLKVLGASSGVLLVIVGIIALLGFLFVVKPAYAVLDVTNELRKDVKDLENALIDRDIVLFNEILDKTDKDLDRVVVARDKNFAWAKNLKLTKEYYTDTDHFVAAGRHGVNAAREFAVLIEPFADAAGLNVGEENKPEGHTGLADAFASWVGVMPEVAANMDKVILEVDALGEELKKVDASKYPKNFFGQPVRDIIVGAQNSLSNVDDYGPDVKKALEVIPGLLGINTGEQRYAIIMQNDKEIRATGGFWTNYATFKIDNAMLASDFTSKDMYSIDFLLDAIDAYHTFPAVPAMYGNYLKVERLYARDANISPDFPTAIDQWNYFYDLAMQVAPWEVKPVSGVIAIDTTVVKELLEVTGPVVVNGVTFDKDNVVLELEKIASLSLAEQANRKKVLGDLMEGMLINVFESDNNLWPKMIDKGVDLVRRKHILINLDDVEAQALVEKYNMGGRIVDPVDGDYVYANQTNLGGDKTNLFVTKEVTHTLERQNNRWLRTVALTYTYTPIGGEYAQLEKRFQDWMRLYVPLGSEFVSLEGSQEPNTGGEERNKTMFDGFIAMGPNESKTMTFKYYLPESLMIGDTYNLYIQKQPGIDTEVHKVIVNGQEQVFTIDMDKKVSIKL